MQNFKTFSALVVLLSLGVSATQIQANDKQDQVYIKLDLGTTTFPSFSAPTGSTVSSESKVGDLLAFSVGLEVGPIMAFELSHNRFGSQEANISAPSAFKFDNEISSNALSIIPTLPLGDKTSVFFEIGQHAWEAESKVDGVSSKVDGSDTFYGLGFNYLIRDDIRTGIQFSRYAIDSDDLETMQVSLSYLF